MHSLIVTRVPSTGLLPLLYNRPPRDRLCRDQLLGPQVFQSARTPANTFHLVALDILGELAPEGLKERDRFLNLGWVTSVPDFRSEIPGNTAVACCVNVSINYMAHYYSVAVLSPRIYTTLHSDAPRRGYGAAHEIKRPSSRNTLKTKRRPKGYGRRRLVSHRRHRQD